MSRIPGPFVDGGGVTLPDIRRPATSLLLSTMTRALSSVAIALLVAASPLSAQRAPTPGAGPTPTAPRAAAVEGPGEAVLPVPATGALLDVYLRQALATAQPDTQLPVVVILGDAVPQRELQRAADARGLDDAGRKRAVAQRLKDHAQQTQAALREIIAVAEEDGRAALTRVLWMGNALVLDATPDLVYHLASRPEVDRIRLDRPLEKTDVQDAAPVQTAPARSPRTQAANAVLAGGGALAGTSSYPVYDDFEAGVLDPRWTVETTGAGYALVSGLGGPEGDWHLTMAAATGTAVDSTASITVELDLTGETDVGIRFKHKEYGDEPDPEDGVFVSDDGVTWHQVLLLNDGEIEYMTRWVALDPLLPGLGISYTSTFFVRFQWRDNFDIPADGFAFDEIEIGPGVGVEPPPEVEPNLTLIQAPAVWNEGYDGTGILVGSIDAGITWQHPDLVNRIWTNPGEIEGNGQDDDANGFIDDVHGWDFEQNDGDINDTDPHGTASAGLVCGDGASGRITGAAPGASIVGCKVLTEAEYWAAQQYLLDIGVDVVTSSYSYKWPNSPDYHMFRQLAEVELAAGIPHANSVGNQGVLQNTHPIPFNISTPGNCPSPFDHPDAVSGGRTSVLACGGLGINTGTLYNPGGRGPSAWEDLLLYDPAYPHTQDSDFWDYPVGGFGGGSPGLIKPDLVTYTNSVMTTALNSGYQSWSGTSASTPQLGGALAVLRSLRPQALPRHLAAALELSAQDLGDPGKDNDYGAGKVQLFQAARRLLVLARFDKTEASPGTPFDIDIFGPPNSTIYGFYQAALTTASGELNLPNPLFFLGVRVTNNEGRAVWNLAVPNDPILVGLTVWFQAAEEGLSGEWGGGPFLSVPDGLTVTP